MGPDVPVLLAALLAGLVGSTHCAVMCGGIATGFSAMSSRPGWGSALQLNLGRVAGYALAGALWGWLPCGLSLSLLTVAWLQANARDAALTMAMFGLGTLPMMVTLTWSGARLGRHWQRTSVRRAAAVFVLAAGLLTIASPWLMQHPALHGVLAALGCQPLPT